MSDPNRHIHNPILNLAKNNDGEWITIDSDIHTRWRENADKIYKESLSKSLINLGINLGE